MDEEKNELIEMNDAPAEDDPEILEEAPAGIPEEASADAPEKKSTGLPAEMRSSLPSSLRRVMCSRGCTARRVKGKTGHGFRTVRIFMSMRTMKP